MDSILSGLNRVGGILDDLIVTGPNDKEHLRNLENTLKRLNSMGVKLKKLTCLFMKPSVEYFAFVVDRHGIHPSPRKVQAIQEVPEPQNATELKSFSGLVNYYHKFIPDRSTLVHPLNRLLMFDAPWAWMEICQVAFKKLKELLLNSPLLAHYDPNKPVWLAVDTSSYGLGAVLSHVSDDGEEKPIAYASRSLSASEQNYSMIEKEALTIVFGIKKVHQYLFGRRFSLLTDHRPLTLLLGPKHGIPLLAASRLQCWAIQLSAYPYDIEYWASKDHANADALSRLPRKTMEEPDDWSIKADEVNRVQMEQAPITVSQICETTHGDPVLSRVMHCILNGWPAEKLAHFRLSYRTTPHTATGCTPVELLMGRRIRTWLDILHPDLPAKMSQKTKLGNHTTRCNFLPGDPVMVRDYPDRKQPWIKGVIQDRLGPVTYQVMVGNLFWKCHVD